MATLNEQIRKILQSPDTEAASRGEVNDRTPGSFPTDDLSMNAHTSDDIQNESHHHERNKLHKPNDPRGNNFTKGHQYSDSGVGIMDNSPHNERAATREPVEQAYAPATGESQEERAKRSAAVAGDSHGPDGRAPGYDEKPEELGTTFGGATIGSNDKQADEQSNAVRSGQQGHGVYNTVTGHGSKEDEGRHHHDDTTGHDQRSFPLVGGAGHHNAQESDPTRRNFDDTTTTASSQPEKTTQEPAHQQKKSNWDGPVGAAVLGAAGTSTFAAGRDREEPKPDQKEGTVEGDTPRSLATPQRQDSSAGASNASDEKKGRSRSSSLFGFLHRSDSKKEERRLAKEQKKEEKLVSKEEERRLKAEGKRHEKETEQHDPAATAAAAAAMHRRDENDNGSREYHEDGRRKSWRESDGPGVLHEDPRVMAPGPGARVARDIYNHRHPEAAIEDAHPLEGFGPHERVKERHMHSNEGSGTSTPNEGDATTAANEGRYNSLSSGTPSGVRTGSNDVTRSDSKNDHKRDAALAGTGAAAAGAAGYGAHKHHEDKKEREAEKASTEKDTHSNRDGALAGAGAAGAAGAAGYGAHKHHEDKKEREAEKASTEKNTHSNRDGALAGAGVAGAGVAGAGAATYGAHKHHENKKEAQQADALTREQKDDGYNHLGTGTASGVRTENADNTTADDSHHGRNAALAGAGVAGAGAAAYGAHEYANRDKNQNTDDANRHPKQTDSAVPIMAGTRHPATEAQFGDNATDSSKKHNIPAAEDRTATTSIPDTTDEANDGHYNVLASGTPSGINTGDHQKTSSDLPPAMTSESSNKGAYATAGIAAAGAGAGATALNKGKNDEDCETTKLVGPHGAKQTVVHECTECGSKQDISKYFNQM